MKTEYIWFKGGHPSKHTKDESGDKLTKVFFGGGLGIIYDYYTNGNVMVKLYFKNGYKHRDGDKPAFIKYQKNGNVGYVSYYKNGKQHREGNKPAFISYYNNGKVNYKIYYKNGMKYIPTKTT